MAVRVNPNDARKGDFLESFPISRYAEMLEYCRRVEIAMVANNVRNKSVVYTRIPKWGKGKSHDTWQIFLIGE